MPSGSFYLTLNSNVNYPGNKIAKFTVPLAKKITFNSRWCVGLSELIFPHSWPTLGTTEYQFIDMHCKGIIIRLPLEPSTFSTWQELERQLSKCIRDSVVKLRSLVDEAKINLRPKRAAEPPPPTPPPPTPPPDDQKEDLKRDSSPPPTPPQDQEETPPPTPPPDDEKDDEKRESSPPPAPPRDDKKVETPPEPPKDETTQTNQNAITSSSPPKTETQPMAPIDSPIQETQSTTTLKRKHEPEKSPILEKKVDYGFKMMYDWPNAKIFQYIINIEQYYFVSTPFNKFLETLERLLTNLENEISFKFLEDQDRFKCNINRTDVFYLEMSDQLTYTLGFSTNTISRDAVAQYPVDLQGGIDTLFIYAPNLVQPSIVSNALAPILRIVVIRGKPDQLRIKEEFYQPHLYDLMQKSISEISIEIRTSSGRLVPFKFGTCILTLNFVKDRFY